MQSQLASSFITLNGRRLFLRATGNSKGRPNAVLFLPPFAEEINKTRHLANKVIQQLATADCNSFMLDNFGTGDSEGDLDQASLDIWREDIHEFIKLLQQQGYQNLNVIAIRFGSLQLLDLLNNNSLALPLEQIVLWQPMFDPAKFWQQFVRIKVAEAMASGTKISQKELEQQLDNGDNIEIAGYPISPAFYHSLQQMNTSLPARLAEYQLSWFETSQLDTVALPVQKKLQQLQQQTKVNFVPLKAEPYWQTTELASADELIAATVKQLAGDSV